MNIIDIDHLIKVYRSGKFRLFIPELHIEKGSVVGLVGNNGAGKTTLLRLLLDLLKPSSGEIYICGDKINAFDDWRKLTAGFLDESFLLDYLTIKEFLDFKMRIYGMNCNSTNVVLDKWQKLLKSEDNLLNTLIRDLSTGNKQKVGIISAAMLSPDLLVLDEPFNYLDPSSQVEVMKVLKELNSKNGTTILISSHNLEYIAEVSSRVLLLENGAIIGDYCTNLIDVPSILHKYFHSYLDTQYS